MLSDCCSCCIEGNCAFVHRPRPRPPPPPPPAPPPRGLPRVAPPSVPPPRAPLVLVVAATSGGDGS